MTDMATFDIPERPTTFEAIEMNSMALAYSIPDAVAASGLGRTRLYSAIKTGDLRTRKFGRRTIILVDDLKSFLEALPTSEAAR
jgi:hypothetical protein